MLNGVQSEAETGRGQRRFLVVAAACVLLSALSAAVVGLACSQGALGIPHEAAGGLAESMGSLVLVSVLTAIVEELVFRGALLRLLMRACSSRSAILASSGLFALMHALPLGIDAAGIGLGAVVASLALKALQAFAFGIVMAGIVMRGGGLGAAMALHAAFDALYFMPDVLVTGAFPITYATAQPEGIAVLLLSTALLVPAALLALRTPEKAPA